jgi:hypothetical protein
MNYKDHPVVKKAVNEIPEAFKPVAAAIWKEIPKELLEDLVSIKNYLPEYELTCKYERLIKDNNLDPEMYHPAIRFNDEFGDSFVKNRLTVLIYALPNKPQAGNED